MKFSGHVQKVLIQGKRSQIFDAIRPSVHVLKMSLIFIENLGRYAHAKNNCQKCIF